ncbi:porin [Labrys sp. KNU-23]|uniref:porin n=1 Tax=Labrys sp. KNU-23 TaxID=2789216 RepID=UPI0011F02B5A|nr:porin [Labrys sp. KNU-23]QEN90492.1 porin [Labrys sp. KNU-23]
MTMKSLLLGAAAGIAAIGTAQAADLPMTKGEAVEYVKVCSAFGPGFFYIPGSDTCLKIGGEIRADYRVFGGTGFSRDDNRSAFGTQGRIWFDARTETEWGLLRSYFQINASGRTASATGLGTQNKFEVDKAFIQFGGLTAGYAHSFFGFYDNDYGNTIWAPYYAESSTVNLLAYTAQFGGGFSATLSIEDGRDHRADNTFAPFQNANGDLVGYRRGGQQFPDVVGQLRLDQSWGGLAVQAAIHQNRSGENFSIDTDGDGIADTDVINPHKSKVGWAVGATALVKIPAIEEGHFIVEGQYANGATHYLGSGNTISGTSDYYLAPVGVFGQGKAGKGWSVVAELGGNITPVLNANLVGSYIDTKYDNAWGGGLDYGVKEYTIAGNLTYTIVKGLTVGLEVAYTREQTDNSLISAAEGETAAVFKDVKRNVWQAGVRLKRKF